MVLLEIKDIHTVEAARRGERSSIVQMIHGALSRFAGWSSSCEEFFFCLPAQTRSIKAVCIITLSIEARQRMPALLSLNNITSEYSTALA